MRRKNNLLLFTSFFISGMAAGLLLSPGKGSQNRAWISNNITELGRWAKLQRKLARRKSKRELSRIQQNVQQGIRQHVPNLYEATNEISLSSKDILDA